MCIWERREKMVKHKKEDMLLYQLPCCSTRCPALCFLRVWLGKCTRVAIIVTASISPVLMVYQPQYWEFHGPCHLSLQKSCHYLIWVKYPGQGHRASKWWCWKWGARACAPNHLAMIIMYFPKMLLLSLYFQNLSFVRYSH